MPAALQADIAAWLSKPWVRRGVMGLSVLLAADSMARWTWRLCNLESEPMLRLYMEKAEEPQMLLDTVLSANPFGGGASIAEAALAPPSGLNLALAGVMEAGAESVALISREGRPQEAFRIGESVAPGVVLEAVFKDRVLLRRGQGSESLLLAGSRQAEGLVQAVAFAPRESSASGAVRRLDGNRYAVPRRLLESGWQAADLFDGLKVVPLPNGGLLIRELPPTGFLSAMGLRPGEVIRAVNGRALSSADDLAGAHRSLSSSTRLELEVSREGKIEHRYYRLE